MPANDPKPKRKSRAKPKTRDAGPPLSKPQLTGKSRGDDLDDGTTSDIEVTSGKQPRQVVNWIQNPHWTRLAITYLSENPVFRLKMFSDSTADAKQEGRKKHVGKDGKQQLYGIIAGHIFKDDPKEQVRYATNPAKYATAVETRFRRLKAEYRKLLERLGATGAGLNPADVRPASTIAGIIGEIRDEWPWWDDLHSFWRELPNYNPIGVQSSEPGTDHAAEAEQLFQVPSAVVSSDDEPEDDGNSAASGLQEDRGSEYQDPVSDGDEDEEEDSDKPHARSISWSPTPPPPILPAKKSAPPQAKPTLGGRASGLAAANTKSAVTTKPKPKKPMTAVDRMQELRESESQRLSRKRELQHEEEMARISVKKVKYQLKLLQAQNEKSRINKRAMTSPSSRRRTRVLNVPPDSPSRSRARKVSEKPLPLPNTHLNPSAGITHSPASPIPSLSSPSHHYFTSTSFASGSTSFASDDASGHFPDLETSNLGMDWLHSTASAATPMPALNNYLSGPHAGEQTWSALPSRSFTDGQ